VHQGATRSPVIPGRKKGNSHFAKRWRRDTKSIPIIGNWGSDRGRVSAASQKEKKTGFRGGKEDRTFYTAIAKVPRLKTSTLWRREKGEKKGNSSEGAN